ncbi:MAG: hypothetical protein M9920_16075 [Verrucomicrobiae bacterium]|nr:hypothetical protein [Verrucomicrobiae bacterium]
MNTTVQLARICHRITITGCLVLILGCKREAILMSADFSAETLQPNSLIVLLKVSPINVSRVDIAQMNLLCAESLPGTEKLNVTNTLAVIDRMAARVRSETERHRYRFQRNPAEFENSEGYFRMIMLMVVLAEDFQVHYASNRMTSALEAKVGDGFFADSRYVFLHGLTGANPQGTCSSLPVLYVAVGRRLGYPLKLVTTKGHLFVRWEDPRERFNFEATGQGANRFPDDYYRHWPFEVTEAEVAVEGYLKSLTPAEELAVFLSIRGMCWQEAGRFVEAAKSFKEAVRLFPGCRSFRLLQTQMEQKAGNL